MQIDQIKLRLEEAVEIIRNMPDEMRKLDYKSTMPEIVRVGNEWIEYNNQAAQDRLRNSARMRPTPRQITEAMEVYDWIRYAASKRPLEIRKVVVAIIFVHGGGAGFRKTAEVVRECTGKAYSHETCRRWFDQAVNDIRGFVNGGVL